MPDDIDRQQEITQLENDAAIRRASRPIPKGEPGVCKECGEESPRLVVGRCAPCRDWLSGHRR